MADIGTFPTIRNVLWSGSNIFKMTATTAVKAGQVVAINAAGVSGAVDPCVAAAGSMPLGVALYGAGAGAEVAIAGPGCIVYVANADDTAVVDAGGYVTFNDNAVGGTVSEVGSGAATQQVVGFAIDDIAASGTGRILLFPCSLTVHA